MTNETPVSEPARVLVVGRSPSVLATAVELLRGQGHLADATNQFDQVLDDYDVSDLDVLVFGGMVPAGTKRYLCDEIAKRNPGITFIQGLVGIPGVIAAQVDAATHDVSSGAAEIGYDPEDRTVRVTLPDAARVTIEALWMTSWRPPEPASTSMRVFDAELAAGSHDIGLPDQVPPEASFATVTIGAQVRVITVGPLPDAVLRMVPRSAADRRLPDVAPVTTHGDVT
jgi:CheY-like chemotaxis protein